jgi:hypothetical protein
VAFLFSEELRKSIFKKGREGVPPEGGLSWPFLFGGVMNQLEKLKKLLSHWTEHNNEHANIYMDWAEKVSSIGNEDLARTLVRLCLEQKRLNRLFEEARRMLG